MFQPKTNLLMIRLLTCAFLIIDLGLSSFMSTSFSEEFHPASSSIVLPTDPFSFQPGSGQEIANTYCVICHSADYIYTQPSHSQEEWTKIIKKMQHTFGCPIPDDSRTPLAQYLVQQNDIMPFRMKSNISQTPAPSIGIRNGNPFDGKSIYTTNCINCHGTDGYGDGPIGQQLIPPAANLTVVGKKSDQELLRIIRNGRPGTAMPPWKGSLSDQDIVDVLSYVRTFSQEFPQR